MSTLSIVHETVDGSSSTIHQIHLPNDHQLPQKNRTMFTKSQKKELEVHFHMNNCAIPDSATREQLALKYRKTPKQIRSLFYRIRSEHVQIQQYLDQSLGQKSFVEVEGKAHGVNKSSIQSNVNHDRANSSDDPHNELPNERSNKLSNKHQNERSNERPTERLNERPNERPNEPQNKLSNKHHNERFNEYHNERPNERYDRHSNKLQFESPNIRPQEHSNERHTERSIERPNKRPYERSNVNPNVLPNVNPNDNFNYNSNHLPNTNLNDQPPVSGSPNPCPQCQSTYNHLPI